MSSLPIEPMHPIPVCVFVSIENSEYLPSPFKVMEIAVSYCFMYFFIYNVILHSGYPKESPSQSTPSPSPSTPKPQVSPVSKPVPSTSRVLRPRASKKTPTPTPRTCEYVHNMAIMHIHCEYILSV